MIVSLFGMHGVGKTTLVENMIKKGYDGFVDKNPIKYPTIFERNIRAADRIIGWFEKARLIDSPDTYVFIERHPMSVIIYSHVYYTMGNLTASQYAEIIDIWNERVKNIMDLEFITIKIQPSFMEVWEKIQKRNRKGWEEMDMSFSFEVWNTYNYSTVPYEIRYNKYVTADRVLKDLDNFIKHF